MTPAAPIAPAAPSGGWTAAALRARLQALLPLLQDLPGRVELAVVVDDPAQLAAPAAGGLSVRVMLQPPQEQQRRGGAR